MARGALRITRYGAIAGAIVGLGLTVVVVLVYVYFATRGGPDSADRALAGTMLVSGVLAFPLSVAMLHGLNAVGTGSTALLTIAVAVMPLLNWLAIGVATGLVVDLARRLFGSPRT